MKRCMILALFASGAAVAQQADITSAQLLSGQADAKLQQLGKEAKAGNKKLVISAPQQWHDLILEQLRRGGSDIKVEIRDSFAESVMVRSADGAEAPAPVATPAPQAQPSPAPAPPARPTPAPAPTPKPAAPAPKPAPAPVSRPATPPPTPKPAPTAAPVATPAQSLPASPAPAPSPPPQPAPDPAPAAATAEPAPAPAPAPAAAPTPAPTAATQTSSGAEVESIRRRLEQNLNRGDAASGDMSSDQLLTGDLVYDQGPVRAVVRRSGARTQLFWLAGEVDLARVEFKELGGDRYQVIEPMRTGTPMLRSKATAGQALFTAVDPASAADERKVLEGRYNGGKPITATVRAEQVEVRDLLYVGEKLIVVVRLSGQKLERFWLVGDINLARGQLSKEGANKYRALSDLK